MADKGLVGTLKNVTMTQESGDVRLPPETSLILSIIDRAIRDAKRTTGMQYFSLAESREAKRWLLSDSEEEHSLRYYLRLIKFDTDWIIDAIRGELEGAGDSLLRNRPRVR